ncbi:MULTISPECIES: GNAT family protein [Arthrobacter]|uniref:GNAT family protein n=2 Tax=Arthrobacter TaxID=1663 RepID=A0ABU9KP20_9MICC|nr:GNAT family protein [Arthrobacter sp. YJM1]MDP5227070.1 GNAT family protein [Arthrobacter sp. YJM1]
MHRVPYWPVTLEHGDIVLRPIRQRDKAEWTAVRQRNREWLEPWEASNPIPGGRFPSYRDMVASLRSQARQGAALPFVITERQSAGEAPRIIGQLTVSNILWGSAMMASIGYWVDRERAGRGIVPTAVALATDFCFQELGMHRMEINIRPENIPSLRVVEKLGFRYEGIRPSYLHINGAWADHCSYALTAEEVPQGLLNRWLAGV